MAIEPRIIRADIAPFPRPVPVGFVDQMPKVTAAFDDGTSKDLFEFYPDEISFCPSEFVGLTESQAHDLRRTKDIAYLRS